MTEFMRAGGWSIWMVLGLALASLVAAGLDVARGELRRQPIVRALSLATVFAIATGLCANASAVWSYASRDEVADADRMRIVLQGLAEAVTPAILGFALLAVAWLLVAVATRRAHDRAD